MKFHQLPCCPPPRSVLKDWIHLVFQTKVTLCLLDFRGAETMKRLLLLFSARIRIEKKTQHNFRFFHLRSFPPLISTCPDLLLFLPQWHFAPSPCCTYCSPPLVLILLRLSEEYPDCRLLKRSERLRCSLAFH